MLLGEAFCYTEPSHRQSALSLEISVTGGSPMGAKDPGGRQSLCGWMTNHCSELWGDFKVHVMWRHANLVRTWRGSWLGEYRNAREGQRQEVLEDETVTGVSKIRNRGDDSRSFDPGFSTAVSDTYNAGFPFCLPARERMGRFLHPLQPSAPLPLTAIRCNCWDHRGWVPEDGTVHRILRLQGNDPGTGPLRGKLRAGRSRTRSGQLASARVSAARHGDTPSRSAGTHGCSSPCSWDLAVLKTHEWSDQNDTECLTRVICGFY